MSTDGPDAADGLADTREEAPQDKVTPPFDPMADTAAGLAGPPSSDDPLRDVAERARVRAKLFGTSRADEAPTIGRYAILKVLGEGGMGTVYACFDDKLDRRLALKLLKGPESDAARKRMLREAQAMAKLSHPNVVPVFEVGEHNGQLFVAMEYVKGMTLARWQSEEDRDWREVLEKYLQAGRGLAAAHAEGLVHRDFKPHNAVVGTDGRVRVLDFGLAAKQGEKDITAVHSTIMPKAKDAALDTPLTETGTVMGTPAYMPPEQFMSGTVDARSDQFSFCVALWEGLYGVRPFEGKSATELFTKIAQGKIAAPGRTEVPTAIRDALLRGLKSEADERWPDLRTLLATLEDTAGAARRRAVRLGAVVAGLLVLVLGYVIVGELDARERRAAEADALAADAAVAAAEANTIAEEKTEVAARAERETDLARVGQRNALLVAAARVLEDSPSEAAALLREAEGVDPASTFGWAQTVGKTRWRERPLQAVLEGHGDRIASVNFSPDGTRIVTPSQDKTARVWNADGGGTTLVLEGHGGTVFSASFSPGGTHIVTASYDGTARVWNADGGGTPVVLEGHGAEVVSASFSPDGTRIVTGSFDKTARVWNAHGGGTPVVLKGHGAEVFSASFSPDGTRIVTASLDRTARVWNADGSGAPTVLEGHGDQVYSARFRPDVNRIGTASQDMRARVWKADG
ncbi:MAG: serine/threonine-protein kinase, partial [Myxococcota bacterium]